MAILSPRDHGIERHLSPRKVARDDRLQPIDPCLMNELGVAGNVLAHPVGYLWLFANSTVSRPD